MAMLFSVMSFAAEASIDFSSQNIANQTAMSTVQVNDDVTITFAGGGNSNVPKFYTNGTAVRMYPKNSFTVTTTTGKLTKIVITFGSSDGTVSIASNVGSYASGTWTGEDASVILTVDPTATSGNRRIQAITVTYGEVADNYVAAPSISGDVNFIESTEVSIAAGEGLKVYYTLDGTDPTNASTEYTAAFEVTETTTVKAIAYNGENASEVASQTFSKAIQVTCAEAKEIALALNDKATTELFYVVKGYVTSTVSDWKSGKQSFWIADTKDGGNVFEAYYCFISEAAVVGDYVQLFGQLKRFGSTPEMSDGQATIIPEPVVEEEINYEPYVLDNLEVTDNGDFYVLYATISDYNLELTFGVNAADGTLMEESSIVFGGEVLPIVSSEPVTVEFNEEVQTNVYTVRVVVEMRDGKVGFEFIMYTAADSGDSTEPVAIAVVGATASVSNDGWLVINGTWNELPFVLKVAGYEDTPYKEYTGTQVGEMEFGEWGVTESDFGFADAVTVIKNGDNLDIMGIFESLSSGTTYNVSVSASFAAVDPETAVDNINASVAPAKMIVNGQLIIVKDGVKFNAAGAVVK